MNVTEDKQKQLLEQVKQAWSEYDKECQDKALNFNIFRMLGVHDKEVLMCKVLHELLNPKGTHAQGTALLKLFFEKVLKLEQMDEQELGSAVVRREEVIGEERRIDLVIETCYRYIPIEVKIYAEEQKQQCFDYYNHAKNQNEKKSRQKEWHIYYLTLYGTNPSEQSTGNDESCRENLKTISWYDHITSWLSECSNVVRKLPRVYEGIAQYQEAVMYLTNQNMKGMQTKMNKILMNRENLETAKKIYDGYDVTRTEILRELFTKIKCALDEEAKQHCEQAKLEMDLINSYYKNQSSTCPGLTYLIKKINGVENEQYSLSIRFEINVRPYIGLFLSRKQNNEYVGCKEIPEEIMNNVKEMLNLDDKDYNADGSWIYWCYVPTFEGRIDDRIPDFKNNNDAYYSLIEVEEEKDFTEGNKCIEFVKSCVEGFKNIYRKLK